MVVCTSGTRSCQNLELFHCCNQEYTMCIFKMISGIWKHQWHSGQVGTWHKSRPQKPNSKCIYYYFWVNQLWELVTCVPLINLKSGKPFLPPRQWLYVKTNVFFYTFHMLHLMLTISERKGNWITILNVMS